MLCEYERIFEIFRLHVVVRHQFKRYAFRVQVIKSSASRWHYWSIAYYVFYAYSIAKDWMANAVVEKKMIEVGRMKFRGFTS